MNRLLAIAGLAVLLTSSAVAAVAMWRRDVHQRAVLEAAVAGRDQVIASQARVRAALEDDVRIAAELLAQRDRYIGKLRSAHESDTRRLQEAFRDDEQARDWRDVPLPAAVRQLRAHAAVPAGDPRARDPPPAAGP